MRKNLFHFPRSRKNKIRCRGIVAIVAVLAILFFLFLHNNRLHIDEDVRIYIPTGSSYEAVVDTLTAHNCLSNKMLFGTLSRLCSYPNRVKAGSYLVKPGNNQVGLFLKLYRGSQDAIRVTIGKFRMPKDLCEYLSERLELEADSLLVLLRDGEVCENYGCTPLTIMGLFISNTYEIYWNISPQHLLDKMQKESDRFWTRKRLKQCEELSLTPNEVITLASIVDEETNQDDEKDLIASVYLNRLNIGMPLQADPTLKYAVGNFSLRRILKRHISVDSPYNTYKNKGLPPGLICTPSISSIDAVLANYQTDYLFFCAREDFSGYHNFATSWKEHQSNAARFHSALNSRKIYQ